MLPQISHMPYISSSLQAAEVGALKAQLEGAQQKQVRFSLGRILGLILVRQMNAGFVAGRRMSMDTSEFKRCCQTFVVQNSDAIQLKTYLWLSS